MKKTLLLEREDAPVVRDVRAPDLVPYPYGVVTETLPSLLAHADRDEGHGELGSRFSALR